MIRIFSVGGSRWSLFEREAIQKNIFPNTESVYQIQFRNSRQDCLSRQRFDSVGFCPSLALGGLFRCTGSAKQFWIAACSSLSAQRSSADGEASRAAVFRSR